MDVARLTSTRSKDRSTQVGAVIVKDRVLLSSGYNGFPRGVNDDVEERHERPEKLDWVCHAEENAILNAARIGAKTAGADMYVTFPPCVHCCKSIIQSDIKRVFFPPVENNPRWAESFSKGEIMLKEAGVEIIYMEG